MIVNAAIIFDLDGTLVDSHAFDSELYLETLHELIGPIDIDATWQRYRHVTDEGILAEILDEAGLTTRPELRSQMRALFGAKVERYLSQGGPCECVPGAIAAPPGPLARPGARGDGRAVSPCRPEAAGGAQA